MQPCYVGAASNHSVELYQNRDARPEFGLLPRFLYNLTWSDNIFRRIFPVVVNTGLFLHDGGNA
jgi:hypothetical protein